MDTYGDVAVVARTREITGVDSDNNDTYDWVTRTIPGCLFTPKGSIELVDKTGDEVVTTDQLYIPTGTTLAPADEVVVHGLTYQVDGEPSIWVNPWTGDTVVRADLKRVTG